MQHIQNIIKETTIPSWLRSVPKNFGEVKAGTLKADEWHTLATIYLQLALVSLWGEVSAIRIACSHSMTQSHIMAYRTCITTWLSTLLNTLPAAKPRPNCHMACHISNYPKLFGPVHSWWCFPFEHLIGHLQHLPINHKFGELEQTVLDSFIQGSKLWHWLGWPDSPAAIKECKLLFDKYISNSKVSISKFVPKRAPKQAVPTELQLLTSQKDLVLHACTNFGGTVFS
ncbi:hypothetical protein PISMIDRAFT_110046 [Pisolithus microcarpus 441]|uniref:Uncharacterized protein n=1 Tax=Pisolithus microcarpus 441 TaxID=765257 RepID=A0A0C9Y043_9AGAM|nr:hypothetical protein PISMIDRAFT_110046 [Pisolithus microcarpus 441]